jgi:multidrug efflux system membrane fusion protein
MRLSAIPLIVLSAVPAAAGEIVVTQAQIDDRKAVIGTVEPVRQLTARTRLGGTVTKLKVREGDSVEAGAEIATIVDEKLDLQLRALEQRIRSQQAQRDQAKVDFERVQELQRRGVSAQAQLDQSRTLLDIAERNLAAMEGDRSVLMQQMAEGAVRAPGAGRVLSVPVSEGRVVLAGEPVATLAEDSYILRLSLPERHAQIMRTGDHVQIGARGERDESGEQRRDGRVRLVYPEISGGRVMADVEVGGLGDYFVGERTRVYVSTGKRSALLAPQSAVYKRAGVFFVRLKSGAEVVVQPGEVRDGLVEILSGLRVGDVLVTP